MKKVFKVLLLIDSSRGYARDLLQGIAQYSTLHSPWIFLKESTGIKTSLRQLAATEADGIITQFAETKKKAQQIMDIGLPTVAVFGGWEELLKDYPNVLGLHGDSAAIGGMGAEHLLLRRLKTYAFCGFASPWSFEREKWFRQKIEEHGFNTHCYRIKGPIFASSWKREEIRITHWLRELPKPVGLMCCNDDVAQEVINASRVAGIRIPEDIAVLGVDNDELACSLCNPPLSSIALNTKIAGYETARLLSRLMVGDRPSKKVVLLRPNSIITRLSTDVLATDDREVAEAVLYIQKNITSPIQVRDVVKAVAICRRAIQQRFRKIMGRSIFEEIRRLRVEHLTKLLLETSFPVSKIAQDLGYTSVDHVSRYFKSEKGITPQAYREKHREY